MNQFIVIALGGSAGAIARFLVANWIYAWLGRTFPFGTLFVNVSGCFLMGFLTALLMQRFALVMEYRAALLIGFLGAYTTFSTFALESLYLFEEGNLLKAILNIFLSVILCLAAVWIGLVLGRKLFAQDSLLWLEELPSVKLTLGVLGGIVLSTLLQLLFQGLQLAEAWRAILLVVLLGLLTIGFTLWIAYRFFDFQLAFQEIFGIFIFTSLSAMLVICLGTLIGNWLWQLNPLR
jgi:CrcB protein